MRTNKKEREYPILLAVESHPDGRLSAWCPYCIEFHHHGVGEGHRQAHCTNEASPFKETGYILKKPGTKEKAVIEDMKQAADHFYWKKSREKGLLGETKPASKEEKAKNVKKINKILDKYQNR
ncbi:hypothetical protein [Priestia megaterium]|uniref:hypothetical protein n=1 Tax=Priestia megaterium TaxID=1404 RepID=UPI003CC91D63